MKDWNTYKLGEIATLNYGKALVADKRTSGNVPVYSSSGISGWHNEALVQSEAVIIGRKGNVGSVFYANIPFYCIDTAYYILPSQKYDLKFLFYKLQSMNLIKLTSDSAVPGLNRETAYAQEIILPKRIDEQKEIASILSSLDNKIELNLQMNQTLESMAQAIFKEWCCLNSDNIPNGWSLKKLTDIAEVTSSKRIFREEYAENGIPFYRGKEITQLSKGESISTELFISSERYYDIKNKFGIPKIGDILITSVGTIGSAWFVDNDLPFYFKDGNVTWVKNYKTNITGEFIYQWLQTNNANEQIKSVTIGSTQQALTISALKGLNILIPDYDTVSKTISQLKEINIKRIKNFNQIHTLIQIRDGLLPKLMTGKLEVKK